MTHEKEHVVIHRLREFVANHYGKILLFVSGFGGGAWFF